MAAAEPDITLPTLSLLAAQLGTGVALLGLWTGVGAVLGDVPFHAASGAMGVGAVTAAAVVTTLLGMPWMPKPASTALLAWLACTMLRMLASPALLLLLYSAPFAGQWPSPDSSLAAAKASALLALATAFLVGLLVEVGVIARHIRLAGHASPTPSQSNT